MNWIVTEEFHRDYATKEYLEGRIYRSIKLLRTQTVEEMDPSRPLAWISLLKIQL